MPLPVGSKAPDFDLKASNAEGIERIRLSDNFGTRNTVLLFFPAAFSSVCTDELCGIGKGQFLDPSDSVAVYGISVDNWFAQAAWAKKEGITIPLLTDYGKKTIHDYQVVIEDFGGTGGEAAARAAFVIDRNGVIRYAEQTPKAAELPNFEAVRKAVSELG